MAELYGRCILDNASMMELRKEVHTEVLAQMQEKGLTVEELAPFLQKLPYRAYLRLLQETIPEAAQQAEDATKTWDDERKAARTLAAVAAVLTIS